MEKTGSVTIPLFHCVFNDGGSITHWETTFERDLYDALPHLYLVCLADGSVTPRRIVGAFMIKTSRHHDDADFAEALGIASALESLQPHFHRATKFVPARIGIDAEPPSERDFLRLAMQQYIKLSAAGTS